MTRTEFKRKYNSEFWCAVIYLTENGKERGILLDSYQMSLTRQRYVYVDSFANRVLLANVLEVESTGISTSTVKGLQKWLKTKENKT